MNNTLPIPRKLVDFCESLAKGLSERTQPEECIGLVSRMLPGIVSDKRLFREILEGMVRGDAYLELQYATMFDSEVILYRDPARLFSVRMSPGTGGIRSHPRSQFLGRDQSGSG